MKLLANPWFGLLFFVCAMLFVGRNAPDDQQLDADYVNEIIASATEEALGVVREDDWQRHVNWGDETLTLKEKNK